MKFLKIIQNILKFTLGWVIWFTIVFISILFSLITWNFSETQSLDMYIVITEICDKSTWECMFFGKDSNDDDIIII